MGGKIFFFFFLNGLSGMALKAGKCVCDLKFDGLGNVAELGEKSVKELDFFGQLFDASFQSLFISREDGDALGHHSRFCLGLLPRFLDRDVVECPPALVLVAVLADVFAAASRFVSATC